MSPRGVCHKTCPCRLGQYYYCVGPCLLGDSEISYSPKWERWGENKKNLSSKGSRHINLDAGWQSQDKQQCPRKWHPLTWDGLLHGILGDNNMGHITSFHYSIKCILPITTTDALI